MKEIDWENLGFAYQPTKSNIRFHYANGQWSEGKLYNTYDINISVCANVLHYGQAAFESDVPPLKTNGKSDLESSCKNID